MLGQVMAEPHLAQDCSAVCVPLALCVDLASCQSTEDGLGCEGSQLAILSSVAELNKAPFSAFPY